MRTRLPARWSSALTPRRDIDGFETRLRRLFEEPFFETETVGWMPSVDVTEEEDELMLTAELPGVAPEDVDIELEGNVLTIHGEKKREHEREETKGERKVRVWERSYGEFSRSFTLPTSVDPEKVAAEFENGVLMVHLPKSVEARGRRIEVEAKK